MANAPIEQIQSEAGQAPDIQEMKIQAGASQNSADAVMFGMAHDAPGGAAPAPNMRHDSPEAGIALEVAMQMAVGTVVPGASMLMALVKNRKGIKVANTALSIAGTLSDERRATQMRRPSKPVYAKDWARGVHATPAKHAFKPGGTKAPTSTSNGLYPRSEITASSLQGIRAQGQAAQSIAAHPINTKIRNEATLIKIAMFEQKGKRTVDEAALYREDGNLLQRNLRQHLTGPNGPNSNS